MLKNKLSAIIITKTGQLLSSLLTEVSIIVE
jgi:hypothetical protein